MMTKSEQRRVIKALLKAMPDEDIAECSRAVCEKVTATDEFRQSKIIMVYNAMQNELDVSLIAEVAKREGKTVCYPRCVGERLLALVPVGDFTVGPFGIREPDLNASYEVTPDLIIVPGLAFDMSGNRLGRGGGYYDRLLKESKAKTIAVAFSVQIADVLPSEPHDMRVDAVVTERS